ncbi:hypothetical protein K503DRAFT_430660 [Rhizopogon vinicolor AM-OR11-026]|uniref:F-box domain-containing protein n=1 Tax=Rhizopogon vinicolor AM-OR11-026 TaxID=1314800 RepID=A0A1B7MPS7_9AGAM|nr:hypothetical protein K503DRAFT_430660 [Rhizopogon vinicolor AM-OR11-026]
MNSDLCGYAVYRYRNLYFVYYNRRHSFPEGLGINLLRSMREHAITKQRQELEEIIKTSDTSKALERQSESGSLEPDHFTLSERRPHRDPFIEWVYEIDLDHNIFHINGIPFFSLEYLPDDESFLANISEDHYVNLACAPGCPPEHQYKKPASPLVADSELATYQSLLCEGTHVAISNLLASKDVLPPSEHVRVSLLETMIGQCMIRPDVVLIIYQIGLVSNHNQLTDQEWLTACSMANFAFIPQMFDDLPELIYHPKLTRKEFTWVREDTVVYIVTHLDDERCLRASISRLIDAILDQDGGSGDYFGVAFSILHCAVVKVVKDAHTAMFSHTGALQFLPSFFADSPSTLGITALARLGYRIDPALFVRAAEICRWQGGLERFGERRDLARFMGALQVSSLPESTIDESDQEESLIQLAEDAPPYTSSHHTVLPPELWREIALDLHLLDLLAFGSVSKLCRAVASIVLRFPHVGGYRLVAVPKDRPGCLLGEYRFLHAGSFYAVRDSVSTIVFVGLGNRRMMSIPFGYRLSPCPLSVRFSAKVQRDATEKQLVAIRDVK